MELVIYLIQTLRQYSINTISLQMYPSTLSTNVVSEKFTINMKRIKTSFDVIATSLFFCVVCSLFLRQQAWYEKLNAPLQCITAQQFNYSKNKISYSLKDGQHLLHIHVWLIEVEVRPTQHNRLESN